MLSGKNARKETLKKMLEDVQVEHVELSLDYDVISLEQNCMMN